MAGTNRKSITFISRQAPYGSETSQVCLDLVLASAVYEQQVNYLFLDDGIYQLLKSQQPTAIGSKNLANALTALELYGVEKIYVDRQSLEQRNLNAEDLIMPAEILNADELRLLVRESDAVFNL